jgi:peptidoglycan/LPS O-acetylase OafA/YrhL
MNKRIVEVDVLRGIAAIAVVLFHFTYKYNFEMTDSPVHFLVQFNYGHLGVELFFMISGFVIFISVEKSKSLKTFLVARFSRLYPTFLITSIFVLIVTYLAQYNQKMIGCKTFLLNLTMINGLLQKTPTYLQDTYWTLNAEINFYVFIVFIIWLKLLPKINLIIVSGIITYLVVNYFNPYVPYFFYIHKYVFIFNNLPLFFAGILFYQLSKKEQNHTKLYLYLGLNFLVYAFFHEVQYIISFALYYILFMAILKGKLSFTVNRLTVFLGSISYALYLVHQNIGYILLKLVNQLQLYTFPGLIFIMVLLFFLAYLITHFIERPFMLMIKERFKDK